MSAATTPCDLLDVDQAAERLGTPVRFVRRLIAERRIRFYKIGRYVRIDRHVLDRFVEDARIDPPENFQGGPVTGPWARDSSVAERQGLAARDPEVLR